MSENPKHALNAILTGPAQLHGINIFPLTIFRYALLDKLESPLINEKNLKNSTCMLISLYIMTLDNITLKKYSCLNIDILIDDTLQWLKSRKNKKFLIKYMNEFTTMLIQQMVDLKYLIPENVNENNHSKSGKLSTNGWLTQLIYNTMKNFNGNIDYVIHEIPLSQLFLLYRQQMYNEQNGNSMTLSDKEMIDGIENG